jgi:hypothetical protein
VLVHLQVLVPAVYFEWVARSHQPSANGFEIEMEPVMRKFPGVVGYVVDIGHNKVHSPCIDLDILGQAPDNTLGQTAVVAEVDMGPWIVDIEPHRDLDAGNLQGVAEVDHSELLEDSGPAEAV